MIRTGIREAHGRAAHTPADTSGAGRHQFVTVTFLMKGAPGPIPPLAIGDIHGPFRAVLGVLAITTANPLPCQGFSDVRSAAGDSMRVIRTDRYAAVAAALDVPGFVTKGRDYAIQSAGRDIRFR